MFLLPHCEATAVLGTTESAIALARDGAAGKSERFPESRAIWTLSDDSATVTANTERRKSPHLTTLSRPLRHVTSCLSSHLRLSTRSPSTWFLLPVLHIVIERFSPIIFSASFSCTVLEPAWWRHAKLRLTDSALPRPGGRATLANPPSRNIPELVKV